MEKKHGQKDLINLDEYIDNCLKNEINENFSIKIDIHGDKLYYDNLMSWLNVRGYKWCSGNRPIEMYYERIKAVMISIYPKNGYILFSSRYDDDDVNTKHFLDYEDIDFGFEFTQQKHTIKVYISGKISGTTDYLERFEKAEMELKSRGYDVINPAKINSFLPTDTTWEEYMEIDYKLMDICDTIYMLKDWESSKGANAELEYANKRKMNIIYENKWRL